MTENDYPRDFEQEVLPHLDAAYNLARWLTCNDQDAQDVVQEAYLRAFRFFGGFRGGDARAWLLKIVRNTCYTWLQQNRPQYPTAEFDEELFGPDPLAPNQEEVLLQNANGKLLRQALEDLPQNSREVLILREFEGMSYREISEVTGMPPGTVMSRLSRARSGLRKAFANRLNADTRTVTSGPCSIRSFDPIRPSFFPQPMRSGPPSTTMACPKESGSNQAGAGAARGSRETGILRWSILEFVNGSGAVQR